MAKPKPPASGEVQRATLTTTEGGTTIINPEPDNAPTPKETEDAQDPGRPARES